jgi:hypothetical protein
MAAFEEFSTLQFILVNARWAGAPPSLAWLPRRRAGKAKDYGQFHQPGMD